MPTPAADPAPSSAGPAEAAAVLCDLVAEFQMRYPVAWLLTTTPLPDAWRSTPTTPTLTVRRAPRSSSSTSWTSPARWSSRATPPKADLARLPSATNTGQHPVGQDHAAHLLQMPGHGSVSGFERDAVGDESSILIPSTMMGEPSTSVRSVLFLAADGSRPAGGCGSACLHAPCPHGPRSSDSAWPWRRWCGRASA